MPNFSNSPELLEPITDSDGLQTNGAPSVSRSASLTVVVPIAQRDRRGADGRGGDRRSGDRVARRIRGHGLVLSVGVAATVVPESAASVSGAAEIVVSPI
jgi:hypothetical protein